MNTLGRAVHLLPAGELFRHGYGSTPVAVCGELVTSGADGQEDSGYCPDCVRAAIRWSAQPWAGENPLPWGEGGATVQRVVSDAEGAAPSPVERRES